MAIMPTIETALESLVKKHTPKNTPRQEYWDPAIKGLSLVVGVRSAAWFALFSDATGKRRRLRLGSFFHPAMGGKRAVYMGLADARDAFALLKSEARNARDPYSLKQSVAESPTVAELCDEYLHKYASQKVTGRQDRSVIKYDVLPAIGEKRVYELTRSDVHRVLDRPKARDAGPMANRTLEVMRKMFSWAVEREIMESNPALGIAKPHNARPRSRVLTDTEIRELWQTLDDWQSVNGLAQSVADQFRILLLTGAREREIGGARWSEIDFDEKTLTLPADEAGRSKSRDTPHVIPLSAPAFLLLRHLKLRAGRSDYVFPSPLNNGADRAARQSRVENAKLKIDARLKRAPGVFTENWRIHDLRRTVRSRLSALKVPPHVAELVIGHSMRGMVKVYDRYDYLDEKREALDRWSELLMEIVGEGAGVLRIKNVEG